MQRTNPTCKRPLLARLGVWLFVAMWPALAPAASVVFTNFGPAPTYNTSQGNPIGNAFDGFTYAEANSFVLSGDAVFSSMRMALSCFASCPDPFSVTLNQDAGNQPGAVLETFVVPTGALGTLGASSPPLDLNSVLNPALTNGARYWVTVSADPNDSIDWNLNVTGDLSATALSADGGLDWFSPSGNTPGAFEVTGVIPEPGNLKLILGAGLLLTLLGRRRVAAYVLKPKRPVRASA